MQPPQPPQPPQLPQLPQSLQHPLRGIRALDFSVSEIDELISTEIVKPMTGDEKS